MSSLSWPRALAWRMQQQMLEPVGNGPVEAVVGRLGAVQAQAAFAVGLSVNTRRSGSRSTDVAAALSDGANVAIAAGVVSGTWSLREDRVTVDWFAQAGALPRRALAEETRRLGQILSRDLELE